MSFAQITDGFVYLALTYPDKDLVTLYNAYAEYLQRSGVTVADFLLVIKTGENARFSSPLIQKQILEQLTFVPEVAQY